MFSAEMMHYDVPIPWKKNYDRVRNVLWEDMAKRMSERCREAGQGLPASVPDPWDGPWRQPPIEMMIILSLRRRVPEFGWHA